MLKQQHQTPKLNYRPLALAIAFAFSGTLQNVAQAATYTVTTTTDSGAGSLREAIGFANASANTPDVILFDSSITGQMINLGSELAVTDTLTITGPTGGDDGSIILDGGGSSSNRHINASDGLFSGKILTLENITLQNGSYTDPVTGFGYGGGAVFVKNADLVLNHSTISSNNTTGDYAVGGGVLVFSGNATINQSTISGNSTTGNNADGGGFYLYNGSVAINQSTISNNTTVGANGGGVSVYFATAMLTESTVSGNSTSGASAMGGGIYATGSNITLTQSTVSGNSITGTSADGGALYVIDGNVSLTQSTIYSNQSVFGAAGVSVNADSYSVTLTNTILSGNTNTTTGEGNFFDRDATTNSTIEATNSFFGDGTAINNEITGTNTDNIFNNAPQLGPLVDNGGPTFTHLPNIGSPVLNEGNNTGAPSSDQRGLLFLRPIDTMVDIGAIELQTTQPSIVTNTNDSGPGSLRQAVLYANNSPGLDTIDFSGIPVNQTITLNSVLPITDSLTISGPVAGDAASLTLDGGGSNRLIDAGSFSNGSGETIILENITLKNGMFDGTSAGYGFGGGAVFIKNADLVINHGLVSGNSTTGDDAQGGGLFVLYGNASLTQSTVSGNSTTGDDASGGGLHVRSGNAMLTQSTVSSNSTIGSTAYGGGLYVRSGSATLNQSTVSGNSTIGNYANGGGLYVLNGDATLTQSTVSGNSTTGDDASGGGLHVGEGNVTLTQSTVVNNSAVASGAGLYLYGYADNDNPIFTTTLNNTILSRNNNSNTQSPDNLSLVSFVLGSGSVTFNVNATHGIFGDAEAEITGVNGIYTNVNNIFNNSPGLGPLQNNGGPTLTRLPNAGSPALDAGGSTALTEDQRGVGFSRVINGTVDIGATESVVLPDKGKAITRAEIVKPILQAALKEPNGPATGSVYVDVADNSFNASWIEKFQSEGLSEGCSNIDNDSTPEFCPNNVVTKEQLAKMIIQVKGLSPATPTGVFTDVPTNAFNADYIEALLDEGFTKGCDTAPNKFCPKEIVTHEIFNDILNSAFP